MFWSTPKDEYKSKYETEKTERQYAERKRLEDKADFELQVKQLKADHEIALKHKQFEIDHFETAEMSALRAKLTVADKELAIANTKLEIMSKVTDVNADVLDVKDLVTKLIEKMPTININSIIAGLSGKETNKE